MMHFLLFAVVPICLYAGESRQELHSPDRRYFAVATQKEPTSVSQLTICDAAGRVVFDSNAHTEFQDAYEFRLDQARWSLDGRMLAVAGRSDGDRLIETFVLILRGDQFELGQFPDLTHREDNPWILPVKWLPGRRLVVDFSGPHTGHGTYRYHGRATVRISRTGERCETLYRYINREDHEE